MRDTPATLARDMLAEVSKVDALAYLAREAVSARTPRRTWRAMQIMGAVIRA